jgi:hypothetical protein
MIAYCCDAAACSTRQTVDASLTLPKGWLSVELEEGTGVMHNPKQKHHLCPACAAVYRRGIAQTKAIG